MGYTKGLAMSFPTNSEPDFRRCIRRQMILKATKRRVPSHKRDTLPFSENKSPVVELPGDSFGTVAMTSESV